MKNNPNNLLFKLSLNKELKGGKALDIGAGKGKDVTFLLKNDYTVDAVDSKSDSLHELFDDNSDVTISEQNMTDFTYTPDTYDIVVAYNSIPFIHQENAETILTKSIDSLKSGGFFCFTLFGKEDGWSDKENMNFFEYETALNLIKDMDVEIYFQSTEKGYGTTMKGGVKFWEVHRFILKKK